ncbi:MAG: hypothetical protein JO116_09340 [Planctomycetaceae bacterium]|nr:hypothetical protein [Planctomycetaceae bacterium]
MRITRRRPDRPDPAWRSLGTNLEVLEGRALLSSTNIHPYLPFLPSDLPVTNPATHRQIPFFSVAPLAHQARLNPQAQFVNNQGKIVSGKDRQGDEWTITVHGPGAVIVTDISPNDGILDDNIDTIQLVGTDPRTTYVTGQTVASAHVLTSGTVLFNRLIDTSGVKSIVLNGFTLQETVTPPAAAVGENTSLFLNTGIYLTGGVGLLQFHNIVATQNQAQAIAPINIVIGDPSTAPPTQDRPIIRLDEIFNTVFNSSSTAIPTGPQTTPTVNILVNGQLHGLDFISSTNQPDIPAGDQFMFPVVGTTGRTAIQAQGIDHLNVRGSAVNVTAARESVPFLNSFSGLEHLGTATFGGNADAVGLDVQGKVGGVKFSKGLGNPAGTGLSATKLGLPADQTGFPAHGLLGGLVTARKIGHVVARPANVIISQTPTNPDFVQLYRQGEPAYFPRNGNALTSAAIVSAGSIGRTTIVGNTSSSEIKAGFDYPSFAAGLEGTRAPSQIAPIGQRGDSINSAISATYRPYQHLYGTSLDTAGPGLLKGQFRGVLYNTGAVTSLGNKGSGFFARHKVGYLPPPQAPKRIHGVLVR